MEASRACQRLGKVSASALREFFRVSDEFRIGSSAQFVEVQPLSLAFRGHAVRTNQIQRPVQAIRQGKHKAQQRGDPHDLREPLACTRLARTLRRRSVCARAARANRPTVSKPQRPLTACTEMAPPGSSTPIRNSNHSTDSVVRAPPTSPISDCLHGREECASGAAGDQPANPAVGGQRDIRPAKSHARDHRGRQACRGRRKRCIDGDQYRFAGLASR